MKKTLSLAVALTALLAFATTSTPEGWLDDYDAALKKAADENKHIVVDFSGSDWCGRSKRIGREVFTTEAFKKAAAEKYILLMVDSPRKKSLLTEKAKKQNPKLVRKYNIEDFPTVVVLDQKGEEVCRLGYEKGGPADYLAKLDAEICAAPDVKKYIKPIADVLNRHDKQMAEDSRAAMEKLKDKFPKPEKDLSKKDQRKLTRAAMKVAQKVMFEEVYAKYVPLYEKAFAEAKEMKVPENMETRKKELIDKQEESFEMLKAAFKAYEEAKKNGTLDKEDEDGDEDDEDEECAVSGRLGLDKWLKDWSENIRTNMEIETCASFRDKKLRPFLMAQMDPSQAATEEERKLLVQFIDFIWDGSKVKYFDKRQEVLKILERTAKPKLLALVKTWADWKDGVEQVVEWLDSGAFKGEDMRCAFWTLRRNVSPEGTKIVLDRLEKTSVDEWLKLLLRISTEKTAAWKARGGGWASEVTEEGWDGFSKHGAASKSAYARAKQLHPYPEPTSIVAGIGPFPDEMFVSTTEALADFPSVYSNYLWYNCYPRWCGSHAKMKAFAERCYETKRHDTMVPYFYAESLLKMVKDMDVRLEDYFKDHADELDKMLEVTLPQMENPGAMTEIRQVSAAIATVAYYLKGDFANAVKTWRSVPGGQMAKRVWDVFENFIDRWQVFSAISGRNSDEFLRLNAMFESGEYGRFIEGVEDLKGRVSFDEDERTYVETHLLAARVKLGFASGSGISATFSPTMNTWLNYNGVWRMDNESAYCKGPYNVSGRLCWNAVIPGEFKVELDIGPEGKKDTWRFEMSQRPSDLRLADQGLWPGLALEFSPGECRASFDRWKNIYMYKKSKWVSRPYSGGNVHVTMVYKDGKATVFLDDDKEPIIENYSHATLLRCIKSGSFSLHGADVRLLSLKASRP